ncbi:unnamed protein product [Choristocarpus tenellus]
MPEEGGAKVVAGAPKDVGDRTSGRREGGEMKSAIGQESIKGNDRKSTSRKRRVIDDDDDDEDDPPMAPVLKSHPLASSPEPNDTQKSGNAVRSGKERDSKQVGDGRPTSNKPHKDKSAPVKVKTEQDSGTMNCDADDVPLSALRKLKAESWSGSGSRQTSGSSNVKERIDSNATISKTSNGISREGDLKIPKREDTFSRPGKNATSAGKGSTAVGKPRPGHGTTVPHNRRVSGGGHSDDSDFDEKPKSVKKRKVVGLNGDGDSDEDFEPKRDVGKKPKQEDGRDKGKVRGREVGKSSSGKMGRPSSGSRPPQQRGKSSSSESKWESGGKDKVKTAATPKNRKFKEMTRAEKIDQAMQVYKWWEEPPLQHGKQWESLEHNGTHFAPEYQPHGVKLVYDGSPIYLSPRQEEVATYYASMPLDGPQLGGQKTVFNKNFFNDFKAVLGKGHKITKFELCDFTDMRNHLKLQNDIRKAANDAEKAAAKKVKLALTHKYSYSIVDNHLEKVGNYNVEPPALFRGRGKHPKTGKLKHRVLPSGVTVNCGEDVRVPQCSVPGYAWERVQHDPTVTWLSTWRDSILAGTKYMMLAASSSFKGKSDMAKYDKAMKLKGFIGKIREDYTSNLNNSDKRTKQIATAVWVIDKLALRVGGEKGKDEADTVGCCSLRVEHLTFNSKDAEAHEIELEFLGKDSMLFKETIDFEKYGKTGIKVFKNLESFCKGKRQSEDVFDYLDPMILNQHLQSLMPGLTAKVFRTFNASETLQRQLPNEEQLRGLSVAEKVSCTFFDEVDSSGQ